MRNGAKCVSKDYVYARFCLQFSNELIVSVLVRHHCLGALLKFAIFLLDRTFSGDYTHNTAGWSFTVCVNVSVILIYI